MAISGKTGPIGPAKDAVKGVVVATTKPARPMPVDASPQGGGIPVAPDTSNPVTPVQVSESRTRTYAVIGLVAFLVWRYFK